MTASARQLSRTQPSAATTNALARDVLAGLAREPKQLSPKYLYDRAGSLLFEEITRLPEYYPTRTEMMILKENVRTLAAAIPRAAALVEFGAGSAAKARILLNAAPQIATYVPVDISAAFLADEAKRLEQDLPRLAVCPVAADFTQSFHLPAAARLCPRVGFFPGSTIGNFEPQEAVAFLEQVGDILGPAALLIIGADLVKDEAILHAAYNDAAGVTAKFNLNVLARMNRELGADFDPAGFMHCARYNRAHSRIEMYLVSRKRQQVHVCGRRFTFQAGEALHTENSYKFTHQSFHALAHASGWKPVAVYTDSDNYFAVNLLTRMA